jgi:hypothetical protein
LISVLIVGLVFANPDFDSDGDGQYDDLPLFDFDAQLTAIIGDGSVGVVGQDYLVAHVDGEIRGVGIASSIPFGPYTGGIAYLATYASNTGGSAENPGEAISFYFYDGATGDTSPLSEAINFVSNASDGSVTNPFQFTQGEPDLGCPECTNDDATVAALGGCAGAVAALGCDFVWAGSPVSEICPVSCGSCPVEDECGVCEGDGSSCAACDDVDADDICDDEDDCVGTYDECGVCNGDGIADIIRVNIITCRTTTSITFTYTTFIFYRTCTTRYWAKITYKI